PPFWDEACKHLAKRDRVMRKLVADFGQARLHSRRDAFTTLARSIVGQQISVKAAQSVWNKLVGLMGLSVTDNSIVLPATQLVKLPPETIKTAGLSARKVEYLRDLARHFADGS